MTELLSGKPIRDFLSYFGNLVSEFPLTHFGGLIDEDSALGEVIRRRSECFKLPPLHVHKNKP